MGFFGSIAGIFAPGNSLREEALLRTDFEAWVAAHKAWKDRLSDMIEGGSEEAMDPAAAASDSQCGLGRWIYSDGMEHFGSAPAFEDLRKAHAAFHKAAGEVAECACGGDQRKARALLHGKFQMRSAQVASLLRALEQQARQ